VSLAEGLAERAPAKVRALAALVEPYHRKYEAIRDTRAVFAYVYYNITVDLAEELEDNRVLFIDPEWVADLAVAFGRRFIAAMDALDVWLGLHPNEEPTPQALYVTMPRSWADVYLAIRGEQSYVLEDLVYSMMAHISFDLPNALLDVAHDVERLGDYHRMNEVLASQTDHIQASVAKRYEHFLFVLDRLAGSFDEFLTNYGIRATRSVAFYNALRLTAKSASAAAQVSIASSAGLFIESVRHPEEWWLRVLVRTGRFLIPRRRRWPKPGREKARWQGPRDRRKTSH
jgi:hypothetical protein